MVMRKYQPRTVRKQGTAICSQENLTVGDQCLRFASFNGDECVQGTIKAIINLLLHLGPVKEVPQRVPLHFNRTAVMPIGSRYLDQPTVARKSLRQCGIDWSRPSYGPAQNYR